MGKEFPPDPGLFDDESAAMAAEEVDIASRMPIPEDPYASDRDREARKDEGNPGREKSPYDTESKGEGDVEDADEVVAYSRTAAKKIVKTIPESSKGKGGYRGKPNFSDDPRLETGEYAPNYTPGLHPTDADRAATAKGRPEVDAVLEKNRAERAEQERIAGVNRRVGIE